MFGVRWVALIILLIGAPLPVLGQGMKGEGGLTHYTLYYPPYWDLNGSDITGLHANLSRKLYREAGLDVDLASVPYARIHQFLFPDDVAIVAYGANPLTDHRLLFPIPQTTIELKIYGLNSKPVTTLEQLVGKDVAIKRGFPLGGFEVIREKKKYHTVSTNSVEQAIRLLLLGRVDYLITLDDPYQKDIKKVDLGGRKIWSRSLEKLDGWPIAIVKNHPRSQELYDKIKHAYENLQKAGVVSYENNRLLLSEDL